MRSLRLEDTPHCGHFRTHRTQYCAAIAAFLKHDVQVNSPAKTPCMRRDDFFLRWAAAGDAMLLHKQWH